MQRPVDLRELGIYVCQIGGKFAGLKERIVKLRLYRVKFAQRVKELEYGKKRWRETEKVGL